MPTLPSDLRNKLERVIVEARDAAEAGARAALEALAVHETKFFQHMSKDQRRLRNHLRARARQLGDRKLPKPEKGGQDHRIDHLAGECAYEHWHRMLFARFLAENGLLIEPQENMAISLDEAEELAAEDGVDVWTFASRCAERMLPQIFRPDDPLLAVSLATEHRVKLERLLDSLPPTVFTASDALGWGYQFWQSKKKDEVNRSEVKIGADELPAVTQLFTESYMVNFLIHNTLGAWWAGQKLTAEDAEGAETEEELRKKLALPGVDWEYLRFVREDKTAEGAEGRKAQNEEPNEPLCSSAPSAVKSPWRPAAGTFDGWPKAAKDIKVLDPCCGSGHFLVAALHHLVPIRMAEEGLSAREAVDAVLRDNLHGLEIDERCCQIAAFALALAAWKISGWKPLPPLHIACSGIGPQCSAEQWLKLAEQSGVPMPAVGREAIKNGLLNLHRRFSRAPTLGSLIDPAELPGDLIAADYETIQPYVAGILKAETADDELRERAIAAAGMVKAADLLAGDYTLVITNVPYLGRGKQHDVLRAHIETHYKDGNADLATAFVLRCIELGVGGGTAALVTPQNWMFLSTYKRLRKTIMSRCGLAFLCELGAGAFATPLYDFSFALVAIPTVRVDPEMRYATILANAERGPGAKQGMLKANPVTTIARRRIVEDGDTRFLTQDVRSDVDLLNSVAESNTGLQTGDNDRHSFLFWELPGVCGGWEFFQRTAGRTQHYDGCTQILRWQQGNGSMTSSPSCTVRGLACRGRAGVLVHRMGDLPTTIYQQGIFDQNGAVLIPRTDTALAAIWCFLSSPQYRESVRALDNKVGVTPATLAKVSFDFSRWQRIAAEKYPHGLPEPQSNDPTQWLFHGHPAGMVAAGPAQLSPWGIADPVGADRHPSLICREPNLKDVLQVAVARLLGYRWPAEQGGSGFQPLSGEVEAASSRFSEPRQDAASTATKRQDAASTLAKRQDAASTMRLDEAARAWVQRCDELLGFADEDGIVCIPSVRGEDAAAERLRRLLAAAFGEAWSAQRERELIAATGSKETTLDGWLRNDFFAQHCGLFHHRPFIWHIWDGRKRDGFHALVNYHKLCEVEAASSRFSETRQDAASTLTKRQDAASSTSAAGSRSHLGRKLLESLTYSYLGDWITRQTDGVKRGEGGAEDRLAAALELQKRLEAILEGEPPLDIFVRWKPLHEQPIGWEPDINDGVRMNIRPLLASDLPKAVCPGARKGAGILRWKPNIHWRKDRGKEPQRPKDEFPWFWGFDPDNPDHALDFLGGADFDGNRWNGCHYTNKAKQAAKDTAGKGKR